jgi:hypothetical protein
LAGEECSHNSLALKYSNILDKLGYLPVSSKSARILHNAAKKSIGMFGKSASNAIIDHMCSINGLSEEELLTNCDLLQTSLYKILRKGADVILHSIKAEILPHAILVDPTISISEISNPQFTVGDILKRVCIAETLKFIRENSMGKHIAFLYENEYSKNRVLSAFFDESATSNATRRILLSKNPSSNHSYHIDNSVSYEELLHESTEYDIVAKKLADWTDKLYSIDKKLKRSNNNNNNGGNKTIRIASEDTAWWRRNGLADLHLSLEKSLGRCVQHNLSIVCGYNISEEEGNGTISTSISSHGYVILLNDPFILYSAPGLEC